MHGAGRRNEKRSCARSSFFSLPGGSEHELEILFLEISILPFAERDFMPLDFYVLGTEQMDSLEIDQVTLVWRQKLPRRNLIQMVFHFLHGFPGFQHGAIAEVDANDMAVIFQIEDLCQLFDLDAAARQPEDHFGAVSLADAGDGSLHCSVELALRKGFQEIIRCFHSKGIDGELIAGRQEDDFCLVVMLSEFCCGIDAGKPRHADIEQDNIKNGTSLDGINKGEILFKTLIGNVFAF